MILSPRPKTADRQATRGIALIVVMVMILLLGAIAGSFAISMRVESRLASNTQFDTDLQWMGFSGVELAKYVLAEQLKIPEPFDSLRQKWAGGPGQTNDALAWITLDNNPLGAGTFSVRIIDCERKANINAAPDPLVQQALTLVGVEAAEFSTIVDSIKDWKDRDENEGLSGAESSYYLSLNPPYVAKNGPLGDISELLLVRGVTPEIYWGPNGANTGNPSAAFNSNTRGGAGGGMGLGTHSRGLGTFSPAYGAAGANVGLYDLFTAVGARQININTAGAAVLQLLPGVDPNLAAAIIQRRAGYDGVEGTLDDMPFASVGELSNVPGMNPRAVAAMAPLCAVRSFTFQVYVEAQLAGHRRVFTALLRRVSATEVQTLYMHWL